MHWQECSGCKAKKDKTPHTFQWVTDKEPTETAPGSKHEQCTVCGHRRGDPVEMPAIPKPNVPKTGDTAPLTLWLMLLASGTVITVVVPRKLFNR